MYIVKIYVQFWPNRRINVTTEQSIRYSLIHVNYSKSLCTLVSCSVNFYREAYYVHLYSEACCAHLYSSPAVYICIVNPAVFICTVKPTMCICTVNPAADLLADFVDGEQRGVGVDRSLQRAQLSHFGRVFPYKQKSK